MPLDETLPIYRYQPDRNNPLRTTISFSQNSSVPSPRYVKIHAESTPNAYQFSLHDSTFTDQVFAACSAILEPLHGTLNVDTVRKERRKSSFGLEDSSSSSQFRIPSKATIRLLNPDFDITLTQHTPSGPFGTPYWEFALPLIPFSQPTPSLLDRSLPQTSELVYFRWKRDSVLSRSTLKCTYHPTPLPGSGKKGADEPDITIALFANWEGSSKETGGVFQGKGELTVFEMNQRRLEIQDWKGLEVALVCTARCLADVWFGGNRRELFQVGASPVGTPSGGATTNGAAPTNGYGMPGRTPSYPPPQQQQQAMPGNYYPPEKQRPPAQQQPQRTAHSLPQHQQPSQQFRPASSTPRPQNQRPPKPRQDAALLAAQEREARRLQAQFEAEERAAAAARQAAVDRETERLRREYEAEARRMAELQRQRQQQAVPPRLPSRTQHRPSQSIPGAYPNGGLAVPQQTMTKRRSFLGLNLFGGRSKSDVGTLGAVPEGVQYVPANGGGGRRKEKGNKLAKKKSSFW
ncbi:hypothetical protein BJ508DRAFT_413758 [Ascobolus immersus RN42]|uniref:Uncharacterized protein n=1 Tax=Ascobolus immersus RN42 TaxID=1160509 RepID=A0A3N4INF3_ASCIM|nr:hypothetical protein BJ508DRAFT_413758 [Ascobolus immersus RN42]